MQATQLRLLALAAMAAAVRAGTVTVSVASPFHSAQTKAADGGRAQPFNTTGYPYAEFSVPAPTSVADPDGVYTYTGPTVGGASVSPNYLVGTGQFSYTDGTGTYTAANTLSVYPSASNGGIMVRVLACFATLVPAQPWCVRPSICLRAWPPPWSRHCVFRLPLWHRWH
jgi:hypothetical protein